jgi:proline dehydrogenase
MTRGLFLYLSRQDRMRDLIVRLPVGRRAARRFIAGETVEQAVDVVRRLNDRGLLAITGFLGEHVHTEAEVLEARAAYAELIAELARSGARSHVWIKLSAFGLRQFPDLCRASVAEITRQAGDIDTRVAVDMEDHTHVDETLAMVRDLRRELPNVGTVIQAYLYRSEADMRALAAEGVSLRLAKGAYQEPPDVAFPRKADVDANMVKLMRLYLSEESRARGAYLGMATHDLKMIEATKRYVAEHGIPRDAFEFQMLYGIRRDLQEQLARDGYRVRVYVPYGSQWYPYFMRRLAERPANAWFLFSNLLKP